MVMAMEVGLVGNLKSFITRKAMGHGHGACIVHSSLAKPWSLPSRPFACESMEHTETDKEET